MNCISSTNTISPSITCIIVGGDMIPKAHKRARLYPERKSFMVASSLMWCKRPTTGLCQEQQGTAETCRLHRSQKYQQM